MICGIYFSEPEEVDPTEELPWWNGPPQHSRDDTDYYLQLPIPLSQVFMVDSESSFEALIESAVDGHTILGLDCEWKPTMVGREASNLSLIQIATRDSVYLLDVMRLEKYNHLWAEFVSICLANPQVMKVGKIFLRTQTVRLIEVFDVNVEGGLATHLLCSHDFFPFRFWLVD